MRVLALLCLFALALGGCPHLPEPTGCTPQASRCHAGAPEVCSPAGRWTPADQPCAPAGVCCWTVSPYGTHLHACVPRERCVPEQPGGSP